MIYGRLCDIILILFGVGYEMSEKEGYAVVKDEYLGFFLKKRMTGPQ